MRASSATSVGTQDGSQARSQAVNGIASSAELESYVSSLVARHIVAARDGDADTWMERFAAAVLFCDLAGFTALTSRAVHQGSEGIEELVTLMEGYWDSLIEGVAYHGGDIVKFAGDGILAVWPVGDDDIQTASLRAARCGLDLATRLGSVRLREDVRLSTKLMIVCGN